VATVQLSAPDSSLIVFDTVQVTAVLRDAGGNVLTGRAISWSSSNTSVATVSTSGRVAAAGVGTATITATSEGVSSTLVFTVAPAPVATVNALLGDSSLTVGATTNATAELRDARGNVLTGRTVTWTTSDAAIATVNATTGLVTAVAVGTATITGTSEGVSDGVVVTVSAAPPAPVATVELSAPDSSLIVFDTVQVTAVLRDAGGNVLTGRAISWSSSNTGLATVSTSGRVAAVGVGTATITATSEGVSSTIVFTVAPAPVATVNALLGDSSLTVGATTNATAELRDARGNVLSGRTITWATSDAAIATVNATTGLVTAVAAGTATITGTSEGISDGVTVAVTAAPPAPVATVNALLGDSSLIIGATTTATAELRDAGGNVLTGRTVTWASSDAAVATVDASTGLVTAIAAGAATITGTSEGISDGVAVTVAAPPPAPVATVNALLGDSSLIVGATTTATAELRDAGGNVLTGRTVTWASSDAAIASVDPTSGLVTAIAAGTATITGTSEGISDGVVLTVSAAPPAPVATVELSAPDSSLIVFDTVQVAAVLKDAGGNTLTGRTITWSTSNGAVATVSVTGQVAAAGAGSTTITATSEGISSTIVFTVALAPVTSVNALLGDSSLVVGATTTATAELRDARGNVLTGRTVTWATSDAAIATVDASTGLITAIAAGTATITGTSEGVGDGVVLTVSAPPPAPVATANAQLGDSSLVVGATTTATAELRDAGGNVLTGRTVTWASSDVAIATVNPTTGLVTAVAVGSATITGTSEGISDGVVLTVSAAPPAPVATVNALLGDSSLIIGATTNATAELRDAGGNALTGRTVTWASSDAAIASVDPTSGLVTAIAAGTATITGTSEGISDGVVLTVSAPPPAPVATVNALLGDSSLIIGATTTATAELKDAGGNVLTGRTVAWASSDVAIATVDASTGLVTAIAAGTATITGTSEGISDGVVLTVSAPPPAPVATVNALLGDSSLIIGATTTATAELKDAGGNVLTGRTVTWATSDAATATVDASTGLVTAIAAGTATITGTSEGISDGVTVTVTTPPPAPVATITLSTPDSSLVVFDTVQVTAVLKDAGGNTLTGRTITWASSDSSKASISPAGQFAARDTGAVIISATSEGVTSTITITIALAPVASVAVTLPSATLTVGATTTAAAELKDARGNVLTGRTIAWTTNTPSVATVDPATGVVTAIAAGTATITATSEGVSNGAVVTVTPP
jgi:uncharacterized protein YjdB